MGRHKHHHKKDEHYDMVKSEKICCDKPCECEHDPERHFTMEEAYQVGRYLGIDFDKCGYDVDQFRIGMDVELEHGTINPLTNVTNDDPILTGKIALAHLNEFPDYYKRLTKMEEEAIKYWEKKKR